MNIIRSMIPEPYWLLDRRDYAIAATNVMRGPVPYLVISILHITIPLGAATLADPEGFPHLILRIIGFSNIIGSVGVGLYEGIKDAKRYLLARIDQELAQRDRLQQVRQLWMSTGI